MLFPLALDYAIADSPYQGGRRGRRMGPSAHEVCGYQSGIKNLEIFPAKEAAETENSSEKSGEGYLGSGGGRVEGMSRDIRGFFQCVPVQSSGQNAEGHDLVPSSGEALGKKGELSLRPTVTPAG